MILSKTSEYALRAVLLIAQKPPLELARAADLAHTLRVPANYLSKILHTLSRDRILVSERGRRGGFRLAVAPHRLPLDRIVAPFEHLEERRSCLLGQPKCSDARPCAAHERWRALHDRMLDFFHQTTVAEVLASPDSVRSRSD